MWSDMTTSVTEYVVRLSIRFKVAVILMTALVGLSACAGTPVTDSLTSKPPPELPVSTELTATPFFPQTQYYCGPAALATVLNASGHDLLPNQIADQVYTPGRKGTLQTEILTGSRRNARLALPAGGMHAALGHVAAGRPVLILQNLGLEIAPQWHYAVLVGYDLRRGIAVLRSGTTRRKILDLKTLEHTWRRGDFWGVVIVPPQGPVPDGTQLSVWLNESLGLERAGNSSAARAAYRTAAAQWPTSTAPLIAIANIEYAAGDLAAASSKLAAAVVLEPDNATALNNLAHVLMEQNDLDAAAAMARRADVAGGGAVARQTLAEIEARRKG